MGRFEQYITGQPDDAAPSPQSQDQPQQPGYVEPIDPNALRFTVPANAPPPPPTQAPGRFDQYVTGDVPPPPAPPNMQFGTLAPADVDPTQQLKWDMQGTLSQAGVPNYAAQRLGNALVDIPATISPMGSILSAADLGYHFPRMFYGDRKMANAGLSALDTIGLLPGAFALKSAYQGISKMVPALAPIPTMRTNPLPNEARAVFEAATAGQTGSYGAPAFGPVPAGPNQFVTPSTLDLVGRGARRGEPVGTAPQHYLDARQSPIRFDPGIGDDISQLAKAHIEHPDIGGFSPQNAPGVHSTLDDFAKAMSTRGTPITPTDIETLRSHLRGLPTNQYPANGPAGYRAIDMIDTIIANPPANRVLAGTPQDFANYRADIANARGDYRAGMTRGTVEQAIDRSGTKSAVANSGRNLENTTRAAFGRFSTTDAGTDRLFGALPEERAAIKSVAEGDVPANFIRARGKYYGGGGGLGQFLTGVGGTTVGATISHLLGFPLPVTILAGQLGKTIPQTAGKLFTTAGNARTVNLAEQVAERIGQNSPEYARRAALPMNAPVEDPRSLYRFAITNALVNNQLGNKNQQTGRGVPNWWNQQFVPPANQ